MLSDIFFNCSIALILSELVTILAISVILSTASNLISRFALSSASLEEPDSIFLVAIFPIDVIAISFCLES
jgi:hypothetical protein